jgi:sugar/nucleoside kinase (ribokinase family)
MYAVPEYGGNVACVGMACVDMQLKGCSRGEEVEGIESFSGTEVTGGGSVCMVTKTLARMTYGETNVGLFVPPPVFGCVVPICAIGDDDMGKKLKGILEDTGGESR